MTAITWETFKTEIDNAIAMRAKRTDANQTKVVEALRKAGLSVAITSALGNGFPDLVVAGRERFGDFRGGGITTLLIELKDPAQKPSDRKLSPAEQKFHNEWKGEIYVCTTAEEILRIFGLI